MDFGHRGYCEPVFFASKGEGQASALGNVCMTMALQLTVVNPSLTVGNRNKTDETPGKR